MMHVTIIRPKWVTQADSQKATSVGANKYRSTRHVTHVYKQNGKITHSLWLSCQVEGF